MSYCDCIFILFASLLLFVLIYELFLDHLDGGSFAKLFVGSVPRTATEEEVSWLLH